MTCHLSTFNCYCLFICTMLPVLFHLLPVTCHLPPVTCQLLPCHLSQSLSSEDSPPGWSRKSRMSSSESVSARGLLLLPLVSLSLLPRPASRLQEAHRNSPPPARSSRCSIRSRSPGAGVLARGSDSVAPAGVLSCHTSHSTASYCVLSVSDCL